MSNYRKLNMITVRRHNLHHTSTATFRIALMPLQWWQVTPSRPFATRHNYQKFLETDKLSDFIARDKLIERYNLILYTPPPPVIVFHRDQVVRRRYMPIYMCAEYCSSDGAAHRRRFRVGGGVCCRTTTAARGRGRSPFKLNPFRDVFKQKQWRAIVVVVRN